MQATKHHEHSSPTFSADGNEVLWSLWERPERNNPQRIMHVLKENGVWGTPQLASFSGSVVDGGPVISCDGNTLFIYRQEPEKDYKIVYFTKSKGKWLNPTSIIAGVSLSVAKNGNIYYANEQNQIYKMEFKNNQYQTPVLLDEKINESGCLDWTPFIANDESYLIFSSHRTGGQGSGDLYISFNDKNQWTAPINMGSEINTQFQERFPSVSPDGKYLFFTRSSYEDHQDVFWVSTHIIKILRQSTLNNL